MQKHKIQLLNQSKDSGRQQAQCEQVNLWEQYCQKLYSIAGVYSDSCWANQSLKLLKNQKNLGVQSKTKQALNLMNGANSKVDLMNKILKNLSHCRTIEQNQQHLVHKLIEMSRDWDKWKQTHIAKLHLKKGFGLLNQEQDYPQPLNTFEVNFDEKKLEEFEKEYENDQQDVEI